MVSQIYPPKLQLIKADSDTEEPPFDLHLFNGFYGVTEGEVAGVKLV